MPLRFSKNVNVRKNYGTRTSDKNQGFNNFTTGLVNKSNPGDQPPGEVPHLPENSGLRSQPNTFPVTPLSQDPPRNFSNKYNNIQAGIAANDLRTQLLAQGVQDAQNARTANLTSRSTVGKLLQPTLSGLIRPNTPLTTKSALKPTSEGGRRKTRKQNRKQTRKHSRKQTRKHR